MNTCKCNVKCTCTYTSCDKHGNCCECVKYHRDMGEVPGCFFTKEYEKTYDRSNENFVKMLMEKEKIS